MKPSISYRQARSARGFTLIELLVVIAIIAILAAILFPVFARAKAKGQQTMCLSNMKQLALGCIMYAQDHNGTWVPVHQDDNSPKPPGASSWVAWRPWIGYDNAVGNVDAPAVNPIHVGFIDIYLKDQGVKKCPVQPKNWQTIYAANGWFMDLGKRNHKYPGEFGTFAKYDDYWVGLGTGWRALAASASDVEQEANTILLLEHIAWAPWCMVMQETYDWFDSPPNDPDWIKHMEDIHFESGNLAWADGHAKAMRYFAMRRWMWSCRKSIYPNYSGL
jgi:prepilin-type N-terminal cleavage/methylation domain-containing protein/prepilin-type processing-associated H-X9-DG protein